MKGGGCSNQDVDMRDRALRKRVAEAPGPCHLCGEVDLRLAGEHWVADHLLERASGGVDSEQNLGKAHSTCNKWRGDRPLTDALRGEVARRRRVEIFIELG